MNPFQNCLLATYLIHRRRRQRRRRYHQHPIVAQKLLKRRILCVFVITWRRRKIFQLLQAFNKQFWWYIDLHNGQIILFEPKPLWPTDTEPVPYAILGDAAFGESRHVLRPYARSNMAYKKKVFEYRHSRARWCIECTLGILSNKFRIFHRPMNTSLEFTIKIVKACCILHNFITDRGSFNVMTVWQLKGLRT